MLIPSHRHRPEDLRLWAELEAADLAWGASPQLAGKVERSIEEVRRFAAAGPCYCGVSAGKDSAALARLLREAGVGVVVPLVYVRAGRHANPDNAAVIAAVGGVRAVDVEYPPGASEREKDRAFFAALAAAGDRYLSGIRADESGGRKIRMRNHGLSTVRACAPLGWWTAQDVFGYLASRGAPVHPAYAMLGGGRWPREHIRVDELGGDRGSQFGRAEWEAEYYGDVLNRMAAGRGK